MLTYGDESIPSRCGLTSKHPMSAPRHQPTCKIPARPIPPATAGPTATADHRNGTLITRVVETVRGVPTTV